MFMLSISAKVFQVSSRKNNLKMGKGRSGGFAFGEGVFIVLRIILDSSDE